MNKNNTVEKKIGESLQLQHICFLNKENSNFQSGESEINITTCGVFLNYPSPSWQLFVEMLVWEPEILEIVWPIDNLAAFNLLKFKCRQ